AFGAAYFVHCITLGNPRPKPQMHAYFGNSYTDDEIKAALDRAGVTNAVHLDDDALFDRTTDRIAKGDVVGWFQGRMEWGPRALGNRSIVAHPGLPNMKDVLNARIKHREPFRPFAPSMLEDRMDEFFTETWPSPFMMLVYPTKPESREKIQATDHLDHTARLQTVSRDQNPRYYQLIETFGKKTGIPVVLNTSFNENEPVVCTPDEAIACYLRTKMDVLVLGNWFTAKSDA
ncbi:MAG: carbamoyltransferase, partial [Myxococcales bacterium]|nr:carbamoyltransferase [Myxococcales bacterium]